VLSFDSLLGSAGGAVFQPILGRSADIWGYSGSLFLSGVVQVMAVPFLVLSRRQKDPADVATGLEAGQQSDAAETPPAAPPTT
jgi:hypothetical protein